MTRKIHAGYWHIPDPESTRGGQHVGTPRGVLVYDEDLQMGILSFSERSQVKNVAECNALLDLAAEVKPGARRQADLTAEDVEALREFVADWAKPHAYGDAPIPSARAIAAIARITKGPTL